MPWVWVLNFDLYLFNIWEPPQISLYPICTYKCSLRAPWSTRPTPFGPWGVSFCICGFFSNLSGFFPIWRGFFQFVGIFSNLEGFFPNCRNFFQFANKIWKKSRQIGKKAPKLEKMPKIQSKKGALWCHWCGCYIVTNKKFYIWEPQQISWYPICTFKCSPRAPGGTWPIPFGPWCH